MAESPIPNHIIIGLGGTGGRIIQSLRRTIYEEFREKMPVAFTRDENGRITGKVPHRVKLGYLYLDSNPELMGQEDVTWKVPGGTLQLGTSQQLLIGSGNLRGVLDNLNAFPGIKPWIGNREAWNAILDSQISDMNAGQKRRLGRFLFASISGSATTDSFSARLQTQVSELTAGGDARCIFHVCAGLAGGTGSGTVVDVIAQIRKQYPYAGTHLVVLYLMLPESNPNPEWARANYHANGYAALMELNALGVGAYQPHDIDGSGQRIDFATLGTKPVPAFDGCYVFSNINENNKLVGVSDYKLHGVVANFLFQKIVVVDDNEWAVQTLKKYEECENGDAKTGTNTPELASDQQGASPLRSRRFLTFGIKRLIIPEEEIREYMCYSSARQMALQSLYNNWSDNFGYTQEPRNENIVEAVRAAAVRNSWRIADDHLLLSSPILEHEKSWKPLDQEWEIVEKLETAAREKEKDHRLWLSGLASKCAEFYEQTFRGHGVQRFYEAKVADAKDQAREICRVIEADLFAEWRDGKYSVHDLLRKAEELIKLLSEFRAGCDERIVEFKRKAGETEERSRVVNAIEQNNREWFKIGPLSDLCGKRKELLEAQTKLYKTLYLAKTRVHAWTYAKHLSSILIDEVTRLKNAIANVVVRLTQVVDGDNSRQTSNPFEGLDQRLAARCVPDEEEDLASDVIKVYEPAKVRDFTGRVTRDRNLQREHCESFRKRISGMLDKRAGFFAFEQDYPLPKLFDALEESADLLVEPTHNGMVAKDTSLTPVLGQNIVKGLASRFPDKMDLRNFIHRVMQESGLFLQFDKTQENFAGPGCNRGSRMNNVSIIMPAAGRGDPEFYDHLIGLLREAKAGVQIVAGSRPSVLTILGLSNLFPLRYASHVSFLKSRFEARASTGNELRDGQARLEIFTEGDGTQFPDLFALTGDQVKQKALPLAMMLKALGLIRRLSNHVTGEDLGWNFYDDLRPHELPIALGQTDAEMLNNCDAQFVNKMEIVLAQRLVGDAGVLLKRQLEGNLSEVLAQVMAEHPNPADPERQKQIKAVEKARGMLNSLSS